MYRQWFSGNDVTIDLVWHLVNTYCVTVNEQYGAIVCVDNFIERLESKQCSRSLCCAMCAASLPYSRHQSLTPRRVTSLAEDFAVEAREAIVLDMEQCRWLESLQSLCILALHEMANGDGHQACLDTSKFYIRLSITIVYSPCK